MKTYTTFSSPSGDGVVRSAIITKNSNTAFFVPEWGWVGSLKLQKKMPWKAFIFVPEWGWVGSSVAGKKPISGLRFSSPSGDGVVQRINLFAK